MKTKLISILITGLLLTGANAETIPPKPSKYFNDNVGLVTVDQAHKFNEELAQFERDTSNQFVVAIYPKMDTDSDVADYAQRIAQSWHVGQAGKNNGVILFVFMKSNTGKGKIRITPGYGLEGALPDATCFNISQKIAPYFKSKNFVGGLNFGISNIISASKGEYKGTGKTVAETPIDWHGVGNALIWSIFWVCLICSFLLPLGIFLHKKDKKKKAEEAERERIEEEKYEALENQRRLKSAKLEEQRRKKWAEYLKNETPAQRKARLAKEAAAAAAAALAAKEEEEARRKRQSEEDDDESSSSFGSSYSGGGSDSFSSPSDSSFECGGGDFGGGGGGSDF